MSERGIPAQDSYPDWLQLVPVQEGEPAEERPTVRRGRPARKAAEPVVEEAPVVEEPAADEAAE
jgi:hypothetical protein